MIKKKDIIQFDNKLMFLTAIFVTSVVIANVLAGKLVGFGTHILIPSAVVTYGFTFLITDIVNEVYGKATAQRVVMLGFYAQIFAMIMIYIAMILPVASHAQDTQSAFEILLGSNARFVLASMIAYFVSQSWDVWMFNLLKVKTNGKHKWIRNNLSTATSQLIDTSIFITIGFIGNVPSIWMMIVSQYVVKLIIALIDTPFFYLFTRNAKKRG